MAGYLYQCRLALLQGIRMVKSKPGGQLAIEHFDDVSFENENILECLVQAKHHITAGALTDKSDDVWKTLRIWSEQTASNPLFPSETKLVLLTTATAPDGSAMSLLRPGSTQEDQKLALSLLIQAAKDSKNESTKLGRKAFLELGTASKQSLIAAIEVCDKAPNLVDMRDEIEAELRLSAPSHIDLVANHLEGWWFSIVATALMSKEVYNIPVQHILRKIFEVAEKLQHDELPLADDLDDIDPDAVAASDDAVFVKQSRASIIQFNERSVW